MNYLKDITRKIRTLLPAIDKRLDFNELDNAEIFRYEIKLDKIEDNEKIRNIFHECKTNKTVLQILFY